MLQVLCHPDFVVYQKYKHYLNIHGYIQKFLAIIWTNTNPAEIAAATQYMVKDLHDFIHISSWSLGS